MSKSLKLKKLRLIVLLVLAGVAGVFCYFVADMPVKEVS